MRNIFLSLLLSLISIISYGLSKPPDINPPIEPYSHSQDFTWISGELKFDPATGWNVVYTKNVNPELAEYGTDDALERVRLYAPRTKFDSINFKPPQGIKAGDMVIVEGSLAHVMEIINDQKAGRTMYEVKSMKRLPTKN